MLRSSMSSILMSSSLVPISSMLSRSSVEQFNVKQLMSSSLMSNSLMSSRLNVEQVKCRAGQVTSRSSVELSSVSRRGRWGWSPCGWPSCQRCSWPSWGGPSPEASWPAACSTQTGPPCSLVAEHKRKRNRVFTIWKVETGTGFQKIWNINPFKKTKTWLPKFWYEKQSFHNFGTEVKFFTFWSLFWSIGN